MISRRVVSMALLSSFVNAAMREAKYKILEDGNIFGVIPSCKGVWANEATVEECREVLQEVLEEWLMLKIRDHDPLPLIAGINLNQLVAEG